MPRMHVSLRTDAKYPAESRTTSALDLLTLIAIAIVATVITNVIHEGLGHGGMCVAIRGKPLVISTVHFDCGGENRLVAAGGTLANLFFGALFWVIGRAVRRSSSWRYFFWLLMTFNLFDAGGYFLFSGVGNFGDWAMVVAGWKPAWAWRLGLIALGTVTYFFWFVPLTLRELGPFLGTQAEDRWRRARRLALVPYLTAGILSCIAGALNPVGPLLILLSAAAASFGGKSGLAWMWTLLKGRQVADSEPQLPGIQRRLGWIVTAIILAIAFIVILGPGIRFHSSTGL